MESRRARDRQSGCAPLSAVWASRYLHSAGFQSSQQTPLKWCWKSFISSGSSSSSAFFQHCYYSRQEHREKPREVWIASWPPTCASPGLGFPWHSWSDKEHSSSRKEQQAVLIPHAQCRSLVSFALPVTHRNFPPGMQQTPTSITAERSWLVTVCRIIIHVDFCRPVGFMH